MTEHLTDAYTLLDIALIEYEGDSKTRQDVILDLLNFLNGVNTISIRDKLEEWKREYALELEHVTQSEDASQQEELIPRSHGGSVKTQSSGWNDLPTELRQHVLSFTDRKTLDTMRLVDRQSREDLPVAEHVLSVISRIKETEEPLPLSLMDRFTILPYFNTLLGLKKINYTKIIWNVTIKGKKYDNSYYGEATILGSIDFNDLQMTSVPVVGSVIFDQDGGIESNIETIPIGSQFATNISGDGKNHRYFIDQDGPRSKIVNVTRGKDGKIIEVDGPIRRTYSVTIINYAPELGNIVC